MSRMDTDGAYNYSIGSNVREGASSCGVQRGFGLIQVFPDSEITVRRGCVCNKFGNASSEEGNLMTSNEFCVAHWS